MVTFREGARTERAPCGDAVKVETGNPGPSVALERRYLTIVFSDLVGYTQLSEQMEPEDLRDLQIRYQQEALKTMESYGGFVASYSGDGILVYFGYPTAHENDAERAVRASLELLRRVPALEAKTGAGPGTPLAVRIGVHSGLLVIGAELLSMGRTEFGVVGEAVNLASRLKDEAPVNSVVVSNETLELVEGLFDTESLGDWRIKGLSRNVAVHRIIGPRPAGGRAVGRMRRGATRMIGRQRELEQLLEVWRKTTQEQRCTVAQVVGEAGVGKTRLIREFCRDPSVAGATILRMNCLEIFATTPLYPTGILFWSRLGLAAGDDEATQKQKMSAYLGRHDIDTPANRLVLASLLGFALTELGAASPAAPQVVKQEQFSFVAERFARMVDGKPAVMWIDDAHWLDPSSAELLPRIIERVARAPVLLLLTTRSFPKGPALPAPDHVFHLEQLQREQCLELAKSVPGAQAVSEDLLARAAAASDGNPLFMEQLVISLVSQGARAGGRRRTADDLPLTLGEMMSERLDRLEGGRRVVQAAACIGRSFAPDFLGALLENADAPVVEPLEALVEAEILRRHQGDGRSTYEFRHALLQRVAYESMIQSDRRTMHGRIADLLKQRSNSVPPIPEVMAHHLTQAGRSHDAINAWLDAAAAASRRSALIEAIAHVRSGLALLDGIEEPQLRRQLELRLLAAIIGPLTSTKGVTSDELAASCARGIELSLAGEPTPLVFPFIFGQFTFSMARGHGADTLSLSEHFLSQAERMSNDSARVVGHRMVGMASLGRGDLVKAKGHFERSLALFLLEPDDSATQMFGQNPQVHGRCLLSLTYFLLGDVDGALHTVLDTLQSAEELEHAHSKALALSYAGLIMAMSGAPDALTAAARRLLAVSEQHGLRPFLVVAKAFLGWALCQRGDLDQGIVALEGAIAMFDSVKSSLNLSGYLAALADARRRNGQLTEAQAACQRARKALSRDSTWFEPDVLRVEALIARDLNPGDPREAEAGLRAAVDCARRSGLPVAELRCLLELRSLLGRTGHIPEVEARIEELVHVQEAGRRAEAAMRARSPGR
jgi:class 3 adenylate cyclase/tetratricopeptide (TPR) repeat protein